MHRVAGGPSFGWRNLGDVCAQNSSHAKHIRRDGSLAPIEIEAGAATRPGKPRRSKRPDRGKNNNVHLNVNCLIIGGHRIRSDPLPRLARGVGRESSRTHWPNVHSEAFLHPP